MAADFINKDVKSFWKKVAQLQKDKLPLPSTVNGCNGEEAIADMWKNHFEGVMNSVKSETDKANILKSVESLSNSNLINISPLQVETALKAAKKGKSAGMDGLASEHFIYADRSVCVHLAMLFSTMLVHGHLPNDFMSSAVIPIIKNKTGDTSDKSNYRPVAIVTACSKIFESILLDLIDDCLITHDNQFGFKSKHSTDLCIYTLKNVIDYYRSRKSPVFACFLDASKAFDRVNHWTLFKKLVDKNVPLIIVRFLMYWYREQQVIIKWGNCLSEPFRVSNGVRQGSILSPKLFAIYVDQLSELLIVKKVGCHIDNVCFNHLFYADDLCLLAPSAIALQKLINVCYDYGIANDILYNPLKSECIVFKPNGYNLQYPPIYLDHEPMVYTQTVKYLGVLLTSDCRDNEEMLRQVRGLYARCNTVLRKFKDCSFDVKKHLFQTYCTNFYCAQLWCNYSKQAFNKVKVAYNNVFRFLFKYDRRCSTSQMLITNNVLNFDSLMRKCIFNFRNRVNMSSNSLLTTLKCNTLILSGAMCNRWTCSLFSV